jgi:hypothetical protein
MLIQLFLVFSVVAFVVIGAWVFRSLRSLRHLRSLEESESTEVRLLDEMDQVQVQLHALSERVRSLETALREGPTVRGGRGPLDEPD